MDADALVDQVYSTEIWSVYVSVPVLFRARLWSRCHLEMARSRFPGMDAQAEWAWKIEGRSIPMLLVLLVPVLPIPIVLLSLEGPLLLGTCCVVLHLLGERLCSTKSQ
mmetsp:Transcript_71132/g.179635  ORF Transcript_71132/g.179635 Transcript_71132/m.179635 type:complete len:108 (+) Transcript_71132:985-1308(+)